MWMTYSFFLGGTEQFLKQVMETLEKFGRFSELIINCEKSALMLVDPIRNPIPLELPQLEVVEKMKYLGIYT